MEKFGLYPLSSGFSDDYSGDFDPRITNPFAAAGFRFGHSLIPENISKVRKDSDGNLKVEEVPLRDAFSDMDHLREQGGIDSLLRGSVVEKSERGKKIETYTFILLLYYTLYVYSLYIATKIVII